ncbi:uncharacterized protein LOC113464618 [Ceratina calcarata]|uniref:Uncharacterized protein LOC113464618 n=1 Tax=Ceratina calcarata TaxID=156304 RepID=A0AAJ7WCC5_9HYME|nr:uncharacterized protein LOC113464618 [Ceratina calcarata]
MESAGTSRRIKRNIVAVLPRNYPTDQMTSQDIPSYLKAIRRIIKRVVEQQIDTSPEFLNHEIKNGGLIVTCATDYDEQWLSRHINNVRFKYRLKVDSPIALENKFLIDGEVTNLENTRKNILNKIGAYNPDIVLTGWKIVNEEMNYVKMTRIITFEMADRSIKCLRRLKYRLRLDEYGVDGIIFGLARPIKTSSRGRPKSAGRFKQETSSNSPIDNVRPSTSAGIDIIKMEPL